MLPNTPYEFLVLTANEAGFPTNIRGFTWLHIKMLLPPPPPPEQKSKNDPATPLLPTSPSGVPGVAGVKNSDEPSLVLLVKPNQPDVTKVSPRYVSHWSKE